MKTRFLTLIILFAATAMAFSSCQSKEEPEPVEEPVEELEEPEEGELDPTSPWFSKAVSWTIGAEAPSVWAAGDSIRVFDHDFVRITFTTNESGASASFSTNEWTGYKPAYAVFSEGIAYCNTDEGIIRQIPVPATQQLDGTNDCVRYAFPAVGKAEEDGETSFKLPSMKNVTARIKFSFVDSKTKALTIKGLEDEQLAGKINVKYEDLSWSAVEGTEETAITLLPSGDAFTAGSTVYASILPGTFAKGFKVTVTNLEGLNVGRAFFTENGIKVDRNAMVELPDAIDTPQSPWKSSVTSINVGAEAPSAFAAGDAITVYDANGAAVSFTTDAATVPANFSTTEWTGEKPTYAVFTTGTPSVDVADADATFGVSVPAQQKIDAGSDADHAAMPAVAAVEPDETVDYKITSMSNAAGRIALTFLPGTKAKSVKIQGMDGEALAGTISLKFSNLSYSVSTPETSVTVTPSGDSFAGGSTVYAAILPGTFAKGLKFTVTDTDNKVIENVFGEETGIVVARNHDTTLPDAVDTKPLNFPEEFVVHVDFTKTWPFQEAWSAGKDNYTFLYSTELPMSFKFAGTCAYDASNLNFSAAGGKLILPQIDGRYLNSVVVVHKEGASKKLEMHKVSDDSQIGNQYKTHVWKKPVPVAKFSPHSNEQCYVLLVDANAIEHIYLRYNSSAGGSNAVKLGFESQWNPFNNSNGEGDGSVYVLDVVGGSNKSPFVGISYTSSNGWDQEGTPDPYTFTQTVDGVSYTFESIRPDKWAGQHMYCWNGGMRSCNYGSPNRLKLPRTGKLVWAAAITGNAYSATKDRRFGILAKDEGEADYTEVGTYTFLATAKQGTGDGSTVENSATYKAWCLDDVYSPTKDYYLDLMAGNTYINFLVLVYL